MRVAQRPSRQGLTLHPSGRSCQLVPRRSSGDWVGRVRIADRSAARAPEATGRIRAARVASSGEISSPVRRSERSSIRSRQGR